MLLLLLELPLLLVPLLTDVTRTKAGGVTRRAVEARTNRPALALTRSTYQREIPLVAPGNMGDNTRTLNAKRTPEAYVNT